MPQGMSQQKIYRERLILARRLPETVCWVNLRRGPADRYKVRDPKPPTSFVWSMTASTNGVALFNGRRWYGDEFVTPRDEWEHVREDHFPERDGWEVRQRFLAVTNPAEALNFLNAVSRFSPFSRFFMYQELPLRFDHFARLQEFTRQAIQTGVDGWNFSLLRCFSKEIRALFSTWPNVAITLYEGSPISFVNTYSAMEAIAATLHIDKLIGATYRFCKREGCHTSFPMGSQQSKIFCSYECAHLQAVRNSRANKPRSTKAKSRTTRKDV